MIFEVKIDSQLVNHKITFILFLINFLQFIINTIKTWINHEVTHITSFVLTIFQRLKGNNGEQNYKKNL